MDKFGKSLKKSFAENYYRLLSVANLTVNKVARPGAQKAFEYVYDRIKVEDNNPKLTTVFKKNLREGMALSHRLAMKPLESVGAYLDQSFIETEKRLREEYGINTDQWLFSLENLLVLEKINQLVDLTFKEVRHINQFNSVRYLAAWSQLQGIYLDIEHKKMESANQHLDYPKEHVKIHELRQMQQECLYYSVFANGTYGKFLNSMYKSKPNLNRLMKYTNYTEDFVFHTNIANTDVLHSFWDTTPYKPAHVIVRDPLGRNIVLCMRGTNNWADVITDLDFHYLSFSIMKEASKDQFFLRFHYNEESQEYLRRRLGDDTRYLNGEVNEPLTGKELVIETGYTHAGMLLSAIDAYKEISPKLESILSKPENIGSNLSITGHSLGGGMSTLMTFLYLVHPLKALQEKVDQKLRGYSYGGASVLSRDFDKYMKEVMRNVVLGYDIVPRLCYGTINDLCKIILAFDEINSKDPNAVSDILRLDTGKSNITEQDPRIAKFAGKYLSMKKFIELVELYSQFKKQYMSSLKLFPMGRVFHLHDVQAQPVRRGHHFYDFIMREIEQKEYFDEIIFTKPLIKHHFPYLYEECLTSDRVLFQRQMEEVFNKEESSATSTSQVKPYTK